MITVGNLTVTGKSMNRSKQTIVESKWLTCENALNFRSSVGTAFSFLLPDLLLWAFLWLSEFLILNNYNKFHHRFHNLWDDKNKNHLNKTRWWRDCHLEMWWTVPNELHTSFKFLSMTSHLSNFSVGSTNLVLIQTNPIKNSETMTWWRPAWLSFFCIRS